MNGEKTLIHPPDSRKAQNSLLTPRCHFGSRAKHTALRIGGHFYYPWLDRLSQSRSTLSNFLRGKRAFQTIGDFDYF